jgi:hypothetical protein
MSLSFETGLYSLSVLVLAEVRGIIRVKEKVVDAYY